MSADELFRDGNRLFRDDLYWAALLRYGQAAEAGMDTPLLHYNSGVAHYRAGQHSRARASLQKAAKSPSLRQLAHYNLGLNAYAAGDNDEALRWFRYARDQGASEEISALARTAIGRIGRSERAEDPVYQHVVAEQKERDIFDFSYFASIGYGNDSNVFRSPSGPYIDFANPDLPLIVPVVQEGSYLPYELGARYMINTYRFEGFYAAYRAAGDYYQDRAQADADEFRHELRIGNEYIREKEDRKREVYSAFRFGQRDGVYYDPDDGLPRAVGGVDIGDRMNYTRYGPDIRLRQHWGKLAMGLVAKGYLYDYEDVEVVPSYDHEYFLFSLHTQYKFTPTSLLRFTVESFSRRYSDRPSFDPDGSQPIGNPGVRYDYLGLSLLARQRITRSMWIGFEYERVDREDRYAGYNNYVRDHYEFEFHWSPGVRFDLELSGYYRNYDFENAFAFNNPALPTKTLETARADMTLSYRFTPRLSIAVAGRFDEFVSNDARIQYDRGRYSLDFTWRQD
jgi:tetratricopeptide (TPR) repeat protein